MHSINIFFRSFSENAKCHPANSIVYGYKRLPFKLLIKTKVFTFTLKCSRALENFCFGKGLHTWASHRRFSGLTLKICSNESTKLSGKSNAENKFFVIYYLFHRFRCFCCFIHCLKLLSVTPENTLNLKLFPSFIAVVVAFSALAAFLQ